MAQRRPATADLATGSCPTTAAAAWPGRASAPGHQVGLRDAGPAAAGDRHDGGPTSPRDASRGRSATGPRPCCAASGPMASSAPTAWCTRCWTRSGRPRQAAGGGDGQPQGRLAGEALATPNEALPVPGEALAAPAEALLASGRRAPSGLRRRPHRLPGRQASLPPAPAAARRRRDRAAPVLGCRCARHGQGLQRSRGPALALHAADALHR